MQTLTRAFIKRCECPRHRSDRGSRSSTGSVSLTGAAQCAHIAALPMFCTRREEVALQCAIDLLSRVAALAASCSSGGQCQCMTVQNLNASMSSTSTNIHGPASALETEFAQHAQICIGLMQVISVCRRGLTGRWQTVLGAWPLQLTCNAVIMSSVHTQDHQNAVSVQLVMQFVKQATRCRKSTRMFVQSQQCLAILARAASVRTECRWPELHLET